MLEDGEVKAREWGRSVVSIGGKNSRAKRLQLLLCYRASYNHENLVWETEIMLKPSDTLPDLLAWPVVEHGMPI